MQRVYKERMGRRMKRIRFVTGLDPEGFEVLTSIVKETGFRSRSHLTEEFLGIAVKLGKDGVRRLKGKALLNGKSLEDFAADVLRTATESP